MTDYTAEDVVGYFALPLTPGQVDGVLSYLNKGVIPPEDPCLSCEPNSIRQLIGRVQREQRVSGGFPRVQEPSVFAVVDEAENVSESIFVDVSFDNEGGRGLLLGGRDDEFEDGYFESEGAPDADEES